MAGWFLERRLSQTASRLRSLRAELAQIDEQLSVVAWEADDHELRSLVSETPSAAFEANEARKHADALARHRRHVADRIADLERRQDDLLDEMARRG